MLDLAIDYGIAGDDDDPHQKWHVYPLGGDRPHVTEEHDEGCWCRPKYYRVCAICLGEGCSGCEDGIVPVARAEADLVIHRIWPQEADEIDRDEFP